MSKPINDGGLAFARASTFANGECQTFSQTGMTLRDWFAGQALNGIMSVVGDSDYIQEMVASNAYAMADAMIEARKEPK